MTSSAGPRPNHYDALGLEPGASAEDVARAFAGKMRLGATPLATMAQICTAYETLRDPRRRSAYDDSIGLNRKPETRQPAMAGGGNWPRTPYLMSAPARLAVTAPTAPEDAVAAEPAAAGFIAAGEPLTSEATRSRAQELLRRLEQQRLPEPQPEPEARIERTVERPVVGRVDVDQMLLRAVEERLGEATPRRPLRVNRTVLVVGSLLAGAGMIGAWAGTRSAGDVTAHAARTVTLALPKAKPAPIVALPAPPVEVATPSVVRRSSRALPAAPASAPVQAGPLAPIAPDSAATDPTDAQPVPAKMPLPDAVVAHTIARIGYACGGVASTSAVEGRAGVYRVTCTSGQSYQATPVGGRYHFRRLSRR